MDALSLWAISNTPVSLAIQTVLYFLSWRIQICSMWEDFSASTLNNTPLTILSLTSNCCKSERLTHQKHKEMAPQPAMMTWWTIFSRVSILLSSFCNIFLLSIDISIMQEVDETFFSLSSTMPTSCSMLQYASFLFLYPQVYDLKPIHRIQKNF